MKTVTQNSKEDLATFEFRVPEGWTSGPEDNLAVIACPEDAVEKKFETAEDSLPFTISIANYDYPALAISEEDKQMYQDLFAGKTGAFEERIMRGYSMSKDSIDAPSTLKGYFGLLLPDDGGDSRSSSAANKPKIDFQYQHYDGTYGKITEVRYSYPYNGKKIGIIQCYREDIPYLITGAFDDSVDLSSGEIALWVADSLKVTEHFSVKDNKIEPAR